MSPDSLILDLSSLISSSGGGTGTVSGAPCSKAGADGGVVTVDRDRR